MPAMAAVRESSRSFDLADGGHAFGRQPPWQDAALGGGDALEVGELLFDAQEVDVGGAQIAAQERLVGPQLELALAQAVALGTWVDGAGLVGQPYALTPGSDDELPQSPRTRVGVELGSIRRPRPGGPGPAATPAV